MNSAHVATRDLPHCGVDVGLNMQIFFVFWPLAHFEPKHEEVDKRNIIGH